MSKEERPPRPDEDVPRESARTILFQFVIFPLGIVAIGVAVFLLFGVLASNEHSIRRDLEVLASGSPQRRWQAAYELSKSLKRGEAAQYPNLHREIESMWRNAEGDPILRRYLTLVLGRLGHSDSVAVLLDGSTDSDVETRIYSLWALGEIRDPSSLDRIARVAAGDPEKDVRKTAVWALGRLDDPRAIPHLVSALADGAVDVRWNAGMALAGLGDDRAVPVLTQMLDRRALDRVEGMRDDQKESAMLSAIPAYARVAGGGGADLLVSIAEDDPSLRVRSAARSALQALERPSE